MYFNYKVSIKYSDCIENSLSIPGFNKELKVPIFSLCLPNYWKNTTEIEMGVSNITGYPHLRTNILNVK